MTECSKTNSLVGLKEIERTTDKKTRDFIHRLKKKEICTLCMTSICYIKLITHKNKHEHVTKLCYLFVCVVVLRSSQQRGHVEPVS